MKGFGILPEIEDVFLRFDCWEIYKNNSDRYLEDGESGE
jgi:hypothetical protein